MDEKTVRELTARGCYQGRPISGKLEETHISWVIVGKKHAFKIKKPVKLSFLDFSSLARRKEYCEKELLLNQRLSPIYLSVEPVCCNADGWTLGNEGGKIMDYAVVMKRLNTGKRMDKLLRKGKVTTSQILLLARQVALFHDKAPVIRSDFRMAEAAGLFNDIRSVQPFVKEKLGSSCAEIIDRSIVWSHKVLPSHGERIQQRIDLGLKRDVHGDLHSGNIFAYARPVIFDCIEFNDDYRQIDVLDEAAFLCMDLEAFGQKPLSEVFMKAYSRMFPCFQNPDDQVLFTYYKCMRANIRAKVHAIAAAQDTGIHTSDAHLKAVRTYLNLMAAYIEAR